MDRSQARILPAGDRAFSVSVPVVVVGAGACGCTAALAAREAGADVLVLEQDAKPGGNTTLSGGQIPAAGTRLQKLAGIEDSPELFAQDIIAKARGQCDAALARQIAAEAAPTVDWLVDVQGVPLACDATLVHPGHSRARMHVSPHVSGEEVLVALLAATARAGIDIACSAPVTHLFADDDGRVRGVRITRRDGQVEDLGCDALILATNGFGGSKDMVRRYIPAIAEAHYHGHAGNRGDAMVWGLGLGAALADMGAFQGFGAVTSPHALHLGGHAINEGGILVNRRGMRFCDESTGYSEQALYVQSQPEHLAWVIFDARCHAVAMKTRAHSRCAEAGAIRAAAAVEDLARIIGCPPAALAATLRGVQAAARGEGADPLGRNFARRPPLQAPYHVARVMGSLFHTQGGLVVNAEARVLRADGRALPNLFAAGGAARGLSGPADWGYLPGAGFLTATVLGRIAGRAAAGLAGRG